MATGYSNVWTREWASLRIHYSTSYDAATNKSTVTITPQFKCAYNYGTTYRLYDAIYNNTAGIYGNGVKLFALGPNSGSTYLYCGSATNTWASFNRSFTFTVSHNANGDASFTVGVLGSVRHYYTGGGDVGSGGLASPVGAKTSNTITIHENAASSIASATASVATQGTFSLSMSKIAATNKHKATITCGGSTLYTSSDFFDTSMSITVPRSWMSGFTNTASLSCTVSVQTYNSEGTAVGSPVTHTLTVTADADMKPSVSAGWVSITAYNTGSAAENIVGFVKGYSKAAVTFNSTYIDLSDTQGASIASYSVTCQGESVSSSPYRTPVLTQNTLVCTVTDSRGRTASETFTVTLMDYAPPTLTGIQIFRCDSLGVADEDGGYYTAKATLTYSSLNSQNVCPIIAYHKAAGGSYSSDGYLVSGQFPVSPPYVSAISADQTYSIKISATDSLGNTVEYYVTLPTRKWAMKFRPDGNGVAFGKAAETDATFEVTSDWAVKLGQPLPVSSGGTGAATASGAKTNLGIRGALYFTSQAVSATTGDICTINDAAITADYVLASCVFKDPGYISPKAVAWTVSAGSLVLNGTCTAATTVDVILVPKDN